MADTKISALPDGVTFDAGDRIPAARAPYGSGDNVYLTRAELKAYFDTLYEVIDAVADHVALGDPHTQYALESALGTLAGVSNLTGVVTSVGAATSIADAALSIAKTNGLQAALDGKQSLDTDLTAIAALVSAADKLAYATGAGTWALTDFTAAARTFLAAATVALQRAALGLDTGDSPQFTGVNIGHASDTTLTRASAGNVNIEGNLIYRAGGTDVPVADGGTGASDAQNARANLDTQIIVACPTNNSAVSIPDGSGGAVRVFYGASLPVTSALLNQFEVRKACRLKAVYCGTIVLGTLGTNETSSLSVRVNNTTDTLVSNALVFNSATFTAFDNDALDIALAAGDRFEFVLDPANFATNPTSAALVINFVLE